MVHYGFQASSLDRILRSAGVTKGALYHHFGSKLELGYAVVEEVLRPAVLGKWAPPLLRPGNPLDAIKQILQQVITDADDDALRYGSPLNNLAQEMSPVDEGFRTRIQGVLQEWRDAIAAAVRRGQAEGVVRRNVDAGKAAIFITAVLEGGYGAAKGARAVGPLKVCVEGLVYYLEALRPRVYFRGTPAADMELV
jgi:AcrR family transcriptional regulator